MTTDQLRLPLLGRDSPLRVSGQHAAVVLGAVAAAALGILSALHPEMWRGLLALALSINLIVLAVKWPRAAAVAALLWLPLIGLVRRLLIDEAGWTTNDPLLLVGPIAALFLCYRIFVVEQRSVAPDRISKLVVLLLVLALAGAFNPFGAGAGGVTGGLAGVIYLGVPLLWFLVGRELGDPVLIRRLIYAVVILAVPIAAYGLYQTEWGSFPQWDVDWYHTTGYAALQAGETEGGSAQLRPWSTFPSNAEYSAFLGIAVAFGVAMVLHRRLVLAVLLPMLGIGVFLSGGRSVMALMLLTIMVLVALRTRNGLLALVVVVLGIGATYGAALAFGDRLDRAANLSGDAKAERQVGGLLNPLDPNESTFLSHWDNLVNGIKAGFTNPVGKGTGASNIGSKAGGGGGVETDNDIADVFVSWGVVGGLAYVAFIVLAFRTVFSRYLRGPPDAALLAVAGLMVVTLGNWLNGGHYATAALLFFFVGWAARPLPEPPGEGDSADRREPPLWQRWGPWRKQRAPSSVPA